MIAMASVIFLFVLTVLPVWTGPFLVLLSQFRSLDFYSEMFLSFQLLNSVKNQMKIQREIKEILIHITDLQSKQFIWSIFSCGLYVLSNIFFLIIKSKLSLPKPRILSFLFQEEEYKIFLYAYHTVKIKKKTLLTVLLNLWNNLVLIYNLC